MAGNVIINAYSLFIVLKDGFKKHNQKYINAAGEKSGDFNLMIEKFAQILLDSYSQKGQQAKDRSGDLKRQFSAQDYLHNLAGYQALQMNEYCSALRDILNIIDNDELMDNRGFLDAKDLLEFSDFVDDFKQKHNIEYQVDASQYKFLKSSLPVRVKMRAWQNSQ